MTEDRDVRGAPTRSIASGLAWNTIYQVFNMALSFGAMLFMVRLLTPAEYGRAAAAVALISMAYVVGSPSFVAHALQLGENEKPDWTLHWNVSMPLQVVLWLILNIIALGFWFTTTYRPIAGLLHVGSIGVLLEWPAQISIFSLRRDLDFRRLRILQGASGAINAIAMIAMAAAGAGPYALLIANNVMPAAGLAFDLLLIRRWRPDNGWWRRPDMSAYRASTTFGLQNLGSSLLARSRAGLEGVLLPAAAGFAQIGIMNRGSALHGLTVARLEGIVMETVYPLLPRVASDDGRFRRVATMYAQTILVTTTCGTMFVGIMGPPLSRLLYGNKWVAADPYIWPAALVGLGITIGSLAVNILLARGKLKTTFLLNGLGAALGLPIIIVALVTHSLRPYIWALAGAQLATAAVDVICAAPHLEVSWKHDLLMPPFVAAASGSVVLLLVQSLLEQLPLLPRILCAAFIYSTTSILVTRTVFPELTASLLQRIPGSRYTLSMLRLERAA